MIIDTAISYLVRVTEINYKTSETVKNQTLEQIN